MAFEYPPIYQDEADKGLSCELVSAAFKAVNIDIDIQFFPVNRMVMSIANGDAVCCIGGSVLFADPEVAKKVTISEPIQYVYQAFLYNAKKYPLGIHFSNLSDMRHYSIGVLNGSGIMRFLEQNKSLHLVTNTTHDGTARQLQAGRVDVWAIVDLTGIMYMKRLFPDEYMNYKLTKAFNIGDVSVAFSKKMDPGNVYYNKSKEGLNIIKKNGTYMKY